MYIVSKEYGAIVNFDNCVEIFTGINGTALIVKQIDGKQIVLQEYETISEAKEAIRMIAEEMNIGKRNVIYVPTLQEAENRIISNMTRKPQHHNIAGKKTKGHGGS